MATKSQSFSGIRVGKGGVATESAIGAKWEEMSPVAPALRVQIDNVREFISDRLSIAGCATHPIVVRMVEQCTESLKQLQEQICTLAVYRPFIDRYLDPFITQTGPEASTVILPRVAYTSKAGKVRSVTVPADSPHFKPPSLKESPLVEWHNHHYTRKVDAGCQADLQGEPTANRTLNSARHKEYSVTLPTDEALERHLRGKGWEDQSLSMMSPTMSFPSSTFTASLTNEEIERLRRENNELKLEIIKLEGKILNRGKQVEGIRNTLFKDLIALQEQKTKGFKDYDATDVTSVLDLLMIGLQNEEFFETQNSKRTHFLLEIERMSKLVEHLKVEIVNQKLMHESKFKELEKTKLEELEALRKKMDTGRIFRQILTKVIPAFRQEHTKLKESMESSLLEYDSYFEGSCTQLGKAMMSMDGEAATARVSGRLNGALNLCVQRFANLMIPFLRHDMAEKSAPDSPQSTDGAVPTLSVIPSTPQGAHISEGFPPGLRVPAAAAKALGLPLPSARRYSEFAPKAEANVYDQGKKENPFKHADPVRMFAQVEFPTMMQLLDPALIFLYDVAREVTKALDTKVARTANFTLVQQKRPSMAPEEEDVPVLKQRSGFEEVARRRASIGGKKRKSVFGHGDWETLSNLSKHSSFNSESHMTKSESSRSLDLPPDMAARISPKSPDGETFTALLGFNFGRQTEDDEMSVVSSASSSKRNPKPPPTLQLTNKKESFKRRRSKSIVQRH